MVAKKVETIDSDGHVLEPADMWEQYIDPKYRERCIKLFQDKEGNEFVRIDAGLIISQQPSEDDYRNFGSAGAIGARDGSVTEAYKMKWTDGIRGGFDPLARIPDMDRDGIDVAVLYPTLGLFLGSIEDPEYAAAASRAYNRWIADYCRAVPDRLYGAAHIPMNDPALAVQELRFAVGQLGLRAGFVRPNPYNDRVLWDPANDIVWKAAAELDVGIGIHSSVSVKQPYVATERFKGYSLAVNHLVEHTFEMMSTATGMIMCGPCDRNPKLRLGFLECGGGWMAGLLDRMDRHFDDRGMNDTGLETRPSEIFRRQCFISFEPVEGALKIVADYIGSENILWATDYPHVDGFWGAVQMIRDMGLPPETERNVLSGGAKRFYGIWK
jgi:uncharacterized protein